MIIQQGLGIIPAPTLTPSISNDIISVTGQYTIPLVVGIAIAGLLLLPEDYKLLALIPGAYLALSASAL